MTINLDLARTAEQKALVGKQAGDQPFFGLATDDCLRDYQELKSRGVRFDGEPQLMRTQRLAVQSSCAPDGSAQAAVVGIAVTDAFEIVFDTLTTTWKARNLRASPRAALVLGGLVAGDERTVQFEGVADEPVGDEVERIKAAYFAAWPEGVAHAAWPGLTYFRVRPTWIRFSDFNCAPPRIVEFTSEQLGA